MSQRNPEVSVIMPVYNANRYLLDAVQSILGQTLADFELLVFDDGSTDGSLQTLYCVGQRDRRLRLFARSHQGYAVWLNEGLREARGAYYARMDADDVAEHDRLRLQVHYLQTHADCVAVGADVMTIDAEGWPIARLRVPISHECIVEQLLRGRGQALVHPVMMCRRAAIERIGGYQTKYETAEDLDLYLRLARDGRLANLPQVLLRYRRHVQSVAAQMAQRQNRTIRAILGEAHQRMQHTRPVAFSRPADLEVPVAAVHLNWSVRALLGGHPLTAAKHAIAAMNSGLPEAVNYCRQRWG